MVLASFVLEFCFGLPMCKAVPESGHPYLNYKTFLFHCCTCDEKILNCFEGLNLPLAEDLQRHLDLALKKVIAVLSHFFIGLVNWGGLNFLSLEILLQKASPKRETLKLLSYRASFSHF